jgi:hypothetical protein
MRPSSSSGKLLFQTSIASPNEGYSSWDLKSLMAAALASPPLFLINSVEETVFLAGGTYYSSVTGLGSA